ncbi:alpha/beta hydrolase family protein [Fontimonas sp. SYSU GA230001]|uniref:alpha/beta hydrolase n=1 Tax=Fontimonas sp. SYSU GA230001 TaxID=3142450 RepID=UPI0032B31567
MINPKSMLLRARYAAAWALTALLGGTGCNGANTGPHTPDVIPPADNPLELVETLQLGPRLQELVFSTPAMPADGDPDTSIYGSPRVRVLLPSGYEGSSQRYPVLYLLHGAVGNYKVWVDRLDAEALTADLPLIVVMPDGGPVGLYSDWYNNGLGGIPMYETYHIAQLVPWIDAHYRTVAAREGRAIAGLSMGGFGAMSYAARHPDLFAAAAAFSGAVDSNVVGQQAVTPETVWGPRESEEVRWRGSNPVDLAPNLAGLNLQLRTGNGMPGNGSQSVDPVEMTVHEESTNMHLALNALGYPHLWDDYGPGGHAHTYWRRDLELSLPIFMDVFTHPAPAPSQVRYRSISADYRVFGWRVTLDRPVLEFSELSAASAAGFTLSGSGGALVTTPAFYKPGMDYCIDRNYEAGADSRLIRADPLGQLQIPVPLGSANLFQQYTPEADAAGTQVYSTTVAIAPAP